MISRTQIAVGAVAAILSAGTAAAQAVISAKSGMINYTEGRVLLDGKPVVVKSTEFPQLNSGSELRTEEGRAEVLLTPGVFLRLAENSGVRMVRDLLTDTRVEVLAGTALVECAEITKAQNVTVLFRDAQLTFRKPGLFRIDAVDGAISAWDGEALVVSGNQSITLKEGRKIEIAGVLAPQKFNNKTGDAFSRWAGRRAETIALSNMAVTRRALRSGGMGSLAGWYFDPYYGFFTFIPGRGMYRNYWGVNYFSTMAMADWYYNYGYYNSGWWNGGRVNGSSGSVQPTYNPSYGYGTVPSRSTPVQATAPAAAASSGGNPRSAGGASGPATPRGGDSGRGR